MVEEHGFEPHEEAEEGYQHILRHHYQTDPENIVLRVNTEAVPELQEQEHRDEQRRDREQALEDLDHIKLLNLLPLPLPQMDLPIDILHPHRHINKLREEQGLREVDVRAAGFEDVDLPNLQWLLFGHPLIILGRPVS